jgi:hypothetical protein
MTVNVHIVQCAKLKFQIDSSHLILDDDVSRAAILNNSSRDGIKENNNIHG